MLRCLPNLEDLDLQYNFMETIPRTICLLSKLRKLNLAHNKLKILPAEIGKLITLELLDLSHNCLEDLPNELGDLDIDRLEVSGTSMNVPNTSLKTVKFRFSDTVLQNFRIHDNSLNQLQYPISSEQHQSWCLLYFLTCRSNICNSNSSLNNLRRK